MNLAIISLVIVWLAALVGSVVAMVHQSASLLYGTVGAEWLAALGAAACLLLAKRRSAAWLLPVAAIWAIPPAAVLTVRWLLGSGSATSAAGVTTVLGDIRLQGLVCIVAELLGLLCVLALQDRTAETKGRTPPGSMLLAVYQRNFFGYFANPTGYLFIWGFVFLSAVAAFFPPAFFNANLANLDQLNTYFPFIMLFFVPAITMSIWADELRQGTDELLLTMPAGDFDIVLGKYLAVVQIFSVSLVIACVSNFIVLCFLGDPDKGLYLSTHLGYWLMGLAMLAVGMVASFLTRNVTVAYIFGALFNAPLALMSVFDAIPGLSHNAASAVRQWSLGGQCEEFGRGVLSLSGAVYFLAIAAIMLYLCVVLIGRRHWARGEDTPVQAGHFLLRCLALTAMAVAAVYFLQNHDLRRDATSEQLTSLSPYTERLVADLRTDFDAAQQLEPQIAPLERTVADEQKKAEKTADKKSEPKKDTAKKSESAKAEPQSEEAKKLADLKRKFEALKIQGPVRIDAYISPDVPERFAQTRLNFLNALNQIAKLGGNMIELKINSIDRFDKLADVAKQRYNIVPGGFDPHTGEQYNIFLGAAFTCGLEKVVLPFLDLGLSPEYEVVRSLCTVTKQKRKTVGVVDTDAHVMGNFTMSGATPEWRLIQELKKQYEVLEVGKTELADLRKQFDGGPASPAGANGKPPSAAKHYDVLLAVQPSAMGPEESENFRAIVAAGQPTLIFEDPFPFWADVPGTYQPRRQQPNPMMGFGAENQQKGNIGALWQTLGVDFSAGGGGEDAFNPMSGRSPSEGTERIVWQRYTPYPKLKSIPTEFDFIDHACGAKEPFCESDPISSKLQSLLLCGPGFIEDTSESVKRLVAKWNNTQYLRQLNTEVADLDSKLRDPKNRPGDDDPEKLKERNDTVSRLVDASVESSLVTGGGEGKKTIQPSSLTEKTDLEKLIDTQLGPGHRHSLTDLAGDLRNRYPASAAGDTDDDSVVLLTKDEAVKAADEAGKLQRESETYHRQADNERATSDALAGRASRAAELKSQAAKLEELIARMAREGGAVSAQLPDLTADVDKFQLQREDLVKERQAVKGTKSGRADKAENAADGKLQEIDRKIAAASNGLRSARQKVMEANDTIEVLKLRAGWARQAVDYKNQAAKMLITTHRDPQSVSFALDSDEQKAADRKESLGRFKAMLATMQTVGDVIKYAQAAVDTNWEKGTRKFVPLVTTGLNSGTVPVGQMIERTAIGVELSPERSLFYEPSRGQSYVLAAHIEGQPADRAGGAQVNVVLVADVDMVDDRIFVMREQGKLPDMDIVFDFDNVTFVLNALDSLAGDDRFLEIRKRRPAHRTFARFDEQVSESRKEAASASEEMRKQHDDEIRASLKEKQQQAKKLMIDIEGRHLDAEAIRQKQEEAAVNLDRKAAEAKEESNRKYEEQIVKIENGKEAKIASMQATDKLLAVLVPPIPLLLVALLVFCYRRSKEREGVSRRRLR